MKALMRVTFPLRLWVAVRALRFAFWITPDAIALDHDWDVGQPIARTTFTMRPPTP